MTNREKTVKGIVEGRARRGLKMNSLVGYGDGSFTVYISSTGNRDTTRRQLSQVKRDLESHGYIFSLEYRLLKRKRRRRK